MTRFLGLLELLVARFDLGYKLLEPKLLSISDVPAANKVCRGRLCTLRAAVMCSGEMVFLLD